MKYSTIRFYIFAILISLLITRKATAQAVKDTTGKMQIQIPGDSTVFVSVKDFDKFITEIIPNWSVKSYNAAKPEDVMRAFYEFAVVEWNRRRKK